MNILWAGFILVAFVTALLSWLLSGDAAIFSTMMTSVFDMSALSIEIALGLVGVLCFWMGVLKVAEYSGVLDSLSKLLQPLFSRLMPDVPSNHPALGHISMNMAANFFGLDNAATPAGLKAMESLQTLNPEKETATNAQILFLVLNTSSVTLFPVTILMYRAQQGAAFPADVFVPILLATSMSTLVGLLGVALVQKINLFDRVIGAYLLGLGAIIGAVVFSFANMPPEQMSTISAAVGNGLMLFAVAAFIAMALYRKVAVYDAFIEGAKGGFEIAVKIMPFLVAMLVAIGMLRSSGVIEFVIAQIASIVAFFGGDTGFVEALPTAIMKPFSGSGARAMMLDTMAAHGVDSFPARLAAIFQGSTETTFYVLTVYFGAVGIKNVRHAIGCGLLADLGGIVAAIFVGYWFFA